MGIFSVRLAPGIRLSATSRGVRAHVGPRYARVHVGGGRPGVSTGAGPFGYYTSVGRRRQRRGGTGYYSGPTPGQIAATAKEQQAAQIRAALAALQAIHHEEFPAPTKATATLGAVPPYPVILDHFERQQLKGVGFFDRAARRGARQRARELADARAVAELRRVEQARTDEQERIDTAWAQLQGNHPETVLAALNAAFQDNQAPTAAVDVSGDEASLVVLVPDPASVLPDREVGTTPAGNLSLKKATKGTLAGWYRDLVAGHVVVSAVEAFTVAPGLAATTVVACRHEQDAVVPVLVAQLRREDVSSRNRQRQSAWSLLEQAGALFRCKGQTRDLVPLEVSSVAGLGQLVDAFDEDVAMDWDEPEGP